MNNVTGKVLGTTLVAGGIAAGLWAYGHRPVDGFMDAVGRDSSWVFNSTPYHLLLAVAAGAFIVGGRKLMRSGMKVPNLSAVMTDSRGDKLDEIKKAKELLDLGAIDAAEFEKLKGAALHG